jgi:glucuronoarabinoxylan endo-1,4-beta-xylanase
MGTLKLFVPDFIRVFVFSSSPTRSSHIDLSEFLASWCAAGRMVFATTLGVAFFLVLIGAGSAEAQTATIDWTNVHQVIDGFGASDAYSTSSMSLADQAFFFGLGSGQLGLSILRVAVPDNGGIAGDCTSISTSCTGAFVGDMQAAIANGGRVYASPLSPPATYTTNGSVICIAGSGNGALATTDYALYAVWLANFIQSLKKEDGITLYAISVQNEPEGCHSYDSAIWSAANIDTFVKTNLGPTFAGDGLSTLIFAPEGGNYLVSESLGAVCGSDLSCNQYIGGFNWHDYKAILSGTNTVAENSYPSGWPVGKKYWETEASCGPGFGPNFCQLGVPIQPCYLMYWVSTVSLCALAIAV